MFSVNEAAIGLLGLTASGLLVLQADGWSKAYCPDILCVKYRAVEKKRFCSIDNFKASYQRYKPVEIVFVLPGKKCTLALNSIVLNESKQLGRKQDLVEVTKEDFVK